jgi:hypothetical protein
MNTHFRHLHRSHAASILLVGITLVAGACQSTELTNPNVSTPSALGSDPLTSLRLSATGIIAAQRSSIGTFITSTGSFGRELYNISPTESRSVTAFYQTVDDPSGGANAGWSDHYKTLRNIVVFNDAVNETSLLTPQQKAAALGFSQTEEALEYLYVILTRHNLGAVIDVLPSYTDLAPFVSRDSVYTYIASRLDSAHVNLLAAGSTPFPLVLPTGAGIGFGDFDTPATFDQFNRALKARVQVYRASLANNNSTLYNSALAALDGSFIQPLAADRSNLKLGPQYFFGNVSGDAANGLTPNNTALYAHPSIRDDGTVSHADLRYVTKILTGQSLRVPASSTTPTDMRFQVYPALTSGIPIIDNEELILLRAEARYFTGDESGALDDINAVRTVSGGLAARGAFSSNDDFITELLAQRRLSLLLQGHRWVDVRRFGRLSSLPLSGPTFVLTANQVIPQGECLARTRTGDPSLACPAFSTQ